MFLHLKTIEKERQLKSTICRLIALLFITILYGCNTIAPVIQTNVTVFYEDHYSPRGTISVVASDVGVNNSLEWAAYKNKFEAKFADNGYIIEQDPNNARFIALVAYGIDNGETAIVTTPIYGQIGGGTTTTTGTAGNVSYTSTSYTMPIYGVVGTSTNSQTEYTRAIALDIIEADSIKEALPNKVYEGRAKSIGTCSVIVEVFDEMLEAMFTDFPGENGRNRKIESQSITNC